MTTASISGQKALFAVSSYGPLFPDRIDRLVKHLHGEVLSFSSASELAHAIQKVVAQLKPLGAAVNSQAVADSRNTGED